MSGQGQDQAAIRPAVPAPTAAEADAAEAALYAKFEALGIPYQTHAHAPVFTVEEAQALRGSLPGAHCKCLFLKDKKGALYLAIVREDLAVDLKWLSGALGAGRFSFGKPELLWETLRVRPGAVTPYALMNDADGRVTPVVDAALLGADLVNFHPLRNDRTTAIAPPDLMRFVAACARPAVPLTFA